MRQSSSGKRSASRSVRNAGLRPASESTVVAGRTVSSTSASTPGTGTTSVANAPDSPAAAASACERAANSSSCSRENPHFSAMSSAETPWLTSPSGYRSRTREPYGSAPVALEPSGTRLIDSTPHATTMSACPAMIACAAKVAACWLDPHCRSIVVPGTVSGKPAASTALRTMLYDCSPTWLTHPPMTSSTSPGSRSLRSTSAFSTPASRSTGWSPLSCPPGLPRPTGVRMTSTMTASRVMPSA